MVFFVVCVSYFGGKNLSINTLYKESFVHGANHIIFIYFLFFIIIYLLYSMYSILQYFHVTNYTHISLEEEKNNVKSNICLKDLAKNKRTADGADRDIFKQ